MAYFDPAYFDPAYFDTGEAVVITYPPPVEVAGRVGLPILAGRLALPAIPGRIGLTTIPGRWRAAP